VETKYYCELDLGRKSKCYPRLMIEFIQDEEMDPTHFFMMYNYDLNSDIERAVRE
jgi:hypothetical protein